MEQKRIKRASGDERDNINCLSPQLTSRNIKENCYFIRSRKLASEMFENYGKLSG